MGRLLGRSAKHRNLELFWTWSPIGMLYAHFLQIWMAYIQKVAPHLVYCAISLPPIHNTLFFSSSLLHWISAATTCICIGMPPFPTQESVNGTSFSSLVTGSTSHKLVTSEVSRILWLYYNDSVSVLLSSSVCSLTHSWSRGHCFSFVHAMSCSSSHLIL